MPTPTYKLIDKAVLTGTQASVVFSSIPQTGYTDLLVMLSARSNEGDHAASLRVYFNGSAANIASRELRAINTTVAAYATTIGQAGYVAANQSYANTFGVSTIYIPNYANGNRKLAMAETVEPSNTAAENYTVYHARQWQVTDAITSLTLTTAASSWLSGSSFFLYGIKNS